MRVPATHRSFMFSPIVRTWHRRTQMYAFCADLLAHVACVCVMCVCDQPHRMHVECVLPILNAAHGAHRKKQKQKLHSKKQHRHMCVCVRAQRRHMNKPSRGRSRVFFTSKSRVRMALLKAQSPSNHTHTHTHTRNKCMFFSTGARNIAALSS